MFLFAVVFMDTAATIPTGAMAERWKFSAFFIYGFSCRCFSTRCTAIGSGAADGSRSSASIWASVTAIVDFAGSSVVHMRGGITALAGAYMLGPRIGKFRRDGAIGLLPGHNMPMAVSRNLDSCVRMVRLQLGSTLAASDPRIAIIGSIRCWLRRPARSRRCSTCGIATTSPTSRWPAMACWADLSRSQRRAHS